MRALRSLMEIARFFREGPRPSKGRKNQNLWLTKTKKKGKQKKTGNKKKKKRVTTQKISTKWFTIYTRQSTHDRAFPKFVFKMKNWYIGTSNFNV
jgi:hypothetical protein